MTAKKATAKSRTKAKPKVYRSMAEIRQAFYPQVDRERRRDGRVHPATHVAVPKQ